MLSWQTCCRARRPHGLHPPESQSKRFPNHTGNNSPGCSVDGPCVTLTKGTTKVDRASPALPKMHPPSTSVPQGMGTMKSPFPPTTQKSSWCFHIHRKAGKGTVPLCPLPKGASPGTSRLVDCAGPAPRLHSEGTAQQQEPPGEQVQPLQVKHFAPSAPPASPSPAPAGLCSPWQR